MNQAASPFYRGEKVDEVVVSLIILGIYAAQAVFWPKTSIAEVIKSRNEDGSIIFWRNSIQSVAARGFQLMSWDSTMHNGTAWMQIPPPDFEFRICLG